MVFCRTEARRGAAGSLRLHALAVLVLSLAGRVDGRAQTLARPGWAGSGLTVSQWWHNVLLVEVTPAAGGGGTVLGHTLEQLSDLQTLGADAILLRGMDAASAPESGSREPRLPPGYGSLDDFDTLLREAGGRRMRLLVELPQSLSDDALTADARFWLNRGASGVYLPGTVAEMTARRHTLRGVLRGYAGGRVLLGDAAVAGQSDPAAASASSGESPRGRAGARGDAPDLTLRSLLAFRGGEQPVDVAALRTQLESLHGTSAGTALVAIDAAAPPVRGDEAKARAATLLLVHSGIALRSADVGAGPEEQAKQAEVQRVADEQRAVAAATSPAAAANAHRAAAARAAAAPSASTLRGDDIFVWYQRIMGLHRGNATMLGGEPLLINHDGEGALVALWRGRAGEPLVVVVNLRSTPLKLQLADDMARLHLRGSFLRTVLRSDAGMGAMSLRAVSLPPFGVYLGQLGR